MAKKATRELSVQIRKVGSGAVVAVRGSVVAGDSEKLQRVLEDLAAERVPVIVLDLAETDFISSQGLGAIITGHLKCRHHKGRIRLINPQQAIRELLQTTRLSELFPVFPTLDEALKL